MNIVFVLDQYGAANNGVTVSARRYAEELRRKGHVVRIVSTGDPGPNGYRVRELRVPVFDKLIKSQGMVFGKAETAVLAQAVAWADIVHFYMPFLLSMKTAKLVKRAGKPATAAFHVQPQNISYSIHMGRWGVVNALIYWWFRTAFFKRFTHIHCPSRFIADQLAQHGYPARLHVISNGIDPAFHYDKRPKPPAWKDRFVVLMIGRLSGEKRQDVLIDAVKQSRYADRIQLVLAGQGPRHDVYVERARGLTHPMEVHFYTQEELRTVIAQADLYVHAADAEIEAMSCMEAFAGGLVPIIAQSAQSATPQFALDERSLFRAGDSADLAAKIDWWIDHPDERRRMERVYSEAAAPYALESCVAQFEDMLRQAQEDGGWR